MTNPYGAPTAELSPMELSGDTYEPKMLSLQGRIGRLRYLAYSMVLGILAAIAFGILVGIMAAAGIFNPALQTFAFLVPAVATLGITVRRLQDLEQSSWWAVLSLIPAVNFLLAIYLVFFAGSAGPNRYGPAPSKNTGLVIAGALILPVVFIVGILAAVAIPAYKTYTGKARAQSGSSF